MWTLINSETVGTDTLVSFVKDQMERNTILLGTATEQQIQDLINAWEAEDALATEQGA